MNRASVDVMAVKSNPIVMMSAGEHDAAKWSRVLARDKAADGQFVYAVRSTGIYCRPSCPSKRPSPEQVRFFTTPAVAEMAGFRACLRCRPLAVGRPGDVHDAAVAKAVNLLRSCADEAPSLEELSAAVGLSRFVLLRAFKRVLGVTPAEFVRAERRERFRNGVREDGASVTEAVYSAGFGSSSRLYETSEETLGMKPSTMKEHGKGAEIRFATADSPLGRMLVAATRVGICAVAFGDSDAALERDLRARFSAAKSVERDENELLPQVRDVLRAIEEPAAAAGLPLDVRQTAFRERAWKAMRAIPRGETRTYGELAKVIGDAKAARAVGTACAENPVAVLIPCHRVLAANGKVENWRWGVERKRRLLEMERER
jgi:AraC family transcriptional regulator, regulatory protein of adaptative response / methylated-DNA-[protein]-cysteine methyltransferase